MINRDEDRNDVIARDEGLLVDLRARGIRLWNSGNRIQYAAPEGVMDDEVRSRILASRGNCWSSCSRRIIAMAGDIRSHTRSSASRSVPATARPMQETTSD